MSDQQQQQQMYWCHMCQTPVPITPGTDGTIACPQCSSEAVEEYPMDATPSPQPTAQQQQQQQQQQPQQPRDPFLSHIFDLFNAVSSRQQQRQRAPQPPQPQQQQVRTFRISLGGGGPIFSMETMPVDAVPGMGGIPFMPAQMFNLFGVDRGSVPQGMSFDDLLHHMFVTSQARGTPPAAKAAVAALKREKVTTERVTAGDACSVCQEALTLGEEVTVLPCGHPYHGDCIRPWLAMHNSCPSCRMELPTDDADYEEQRKKKKT